MQDKKIVNALDKLLGDVSNFYYKKVHPLSEFLHNNTAPSGSGRFNLGTISEVIHKLEEDLRELKACSLDIKKNQDTTPKIMMLEDYALSLTMSIKLKRRANVKFSSEGDYLIGLEAESMPDSITQYLEAVKSIKEDYPRNFDYTSLLIDCVLNALGYDGLSESLIIAQRLRKTHIGKLFQEYSNLLKKHLSKGTPLGDFIGVKELKEREVPLIERIFSSIPEENKLRKGKGYKNLIKMLKRESNWANPETLTKLVVANRHYERINSVLENYNSLSYDLYNKQFEIYKGKDIRMRGIRGYSKQKKELKNMFKRFSEGMTIPHIVLKGPPGTGKTSIVLANTKYNKNIKFVFTDGYEIKEVPKVLYYLSRFKDKKFIVFIDDTEYDESNNKKTWDYLRQIIEGTSKFPEGIRLVISTNNWEKFPLSFKSRFGNVTEMGYPNPRTQKSIAKYHKKFYNVGEDITQIIGEAKKIAEKEPISGRTIEQVCKSWGLYNPETEIINKNSDGG